MDLPSVVARFINTTSSHIFLTGKAGTGKTTFLKQLAEVTHKTFIVVAPTGIAALNAGGVTIHSQFLLPPANFIPDRNADVSQGGQFINQNVLARHHPINSARKKVLRAIDLLVIDEVSMLRADLLDAIDYRLRAARGNFRQNFGGVQILFIGDLYQLPPVVKNDAWNVLRRYYNSPWFFEAKALADQPPVYVEFDKIYRQSDPTFIQILNNIRNNEITAADIEALNKRHVPEEATEEVITLTTHNYKADELNQRALQALDNPVKTFNAIIADDFPESMYPVLTKIELKKGARIMFVRNDSEEKQYYNGKLAIITEINGDEIWVEMVEEKRLYKLKRERWENKRYGVSEKDQELSSEVLGSFEQYPVKLAWAITVHKSQGLTFAKAVIDVEQAFADGQVYVALSRLRSLDGLILRSHINPSVIGTDKQVKAFADQHHRPDGLGEVIKIRQHSFIIELLDKTFDFTILINDLKYILKQSSDPSLKEETMQSVLGKLGAVLESQQPNCLKFRMQLEELMKAAQYEQLLERIRKGSSYYRELLTEQAKALLHHLESTKRQKRAKTYTAQLTELDQALDKKMMEIDKAARWVDIILSGEDNIDFAELTSKHHAERDQWKEDILKVLGDEPLKIKKARKGSKRGKGVPSTFEITIGFLKSGLTLDQVAAERGLTKGTIEGHLAKAVETGQIKLADHMNDEIIEEISSAIRELPENPVSKEVYVKLKGKYGYGQIHAVMAHVKGGG